MGKGIYAIARYEAFMALEIVIYSSPLAIWMRMTSSPDGFLSDISLPLPWPRKILKIETYHQ
jgi:hypothetical protein